MISRLVDQKGFDLIADGLDELMELGIDLAVLGTGLQKYHDFFTAAARRYPGRLSVALRFDNTLAHLIEGGADIFLMPSLYEPCGLNQMYSLRYGTLPVVRETGGLADTVTDDDAHPGNGVGFAFMEYKVEAMVEAMRRAVKAYQDPKRWSGIIRRAMARDYSWKRSAAKYMDLYGAALQRRMALGLA
jgi:starch synthase